MAKIVLSINGTVLGNYFLEKDRFVIGRKKETDVHLNDQGVSKEHAVILTVGNDQILEDLKSTNGTQVNGKKIDKHILQNGDVVEIGRYNLKYINQKAIPDMDFDKTLMMPALDKALLDSLQAKDGADPVTVIASASARSVKATIPLAEIKGMGGEIMGKNQELKRVLTPIGIRGEQFAVIARRPHGYFLCHVVGRKYPLVNGKSIGTEDYSLENLDVIEVGGEKAEFVFR